MSATAPRSKRPFQPSITSYFARADRADHVSESQQQGIHVLPANIQASLLNVGMRVRKSVPEGYRTHKTMPAANATATTPPVADRHTYSPSRPAELVPFCGLHKTGGYITQPQYQPPVTSIYNDSAALPATNSTHPVGAYDIRFDASDFRSLSSQKSSTSTLSTDSLPAANVHKRRFEDEDDEENDVTGHDAGNAKSLFPTINTSLPNDVFDDDVQVSPRTLYPVSHTAMPNLNAMRPIVRPKSRRKNMAMVGEGAHAADVQMGRAGADRLDFGEAAFLQPPCGWDEAGEVEMGDI